MKNIEKEDLNIFHYTIIGSGTEYVLNHLKFIGKPPLKYHALSNFKMDYKSKDKEAENIVESYPELLFSLLEILDEAFMKRTEESETSPGYQSIMHLQNIILNNLFKIIINCFRYLKTAECNYFLYLKIINDCCQTYFQKNKKDPMKFKPLIPIMIEHLMHIRKEMGKNKELNVIMLNLPIGVKHLFESMLNIFDFIQESFQNKDENSGMKILTFLIRVVSNMNDIIDPVIVPQLPQFSKDLFDAFRSSYLKKDQSLRPASGRRQDQEAAKEDICGTMFWILGKLGKKCRIYNDMKVFEYKKETINGIKMLFVERDFEEGKGKNVFTSFSISPIGQPYNYPDSVEHILEFLTP